MTENLANAEAHDAAEELPTGTKLLSGQFDVTSYLNHGGFGITYLATNSLNRQVVVKECFPSSLCRRSRMIVQARSRAHVKELQNVVRLFMNEALALAKLDHPNIVGVHQVFEDNGTAYMVLDYVKGTDLLSHISNPGRKLNAAQVKSLLEKLLDAVGFVHEAGLLHRDISPDNIILNEDGEPILIDFGAARQQATNTTKALSALRVVKDGYSPQEFYLQGSDQSPSSDLYSLAATFYHVITGEAPPDSQVRLTAHVAEDGDPYVPLAQKTDEFDAQFCAAIDKAMSILPRDRVQSAAEWKTLINEPSAPKQAKLLSKVPSRRLSRQTRHIVPPKRVRSVARAKKQINKPALLLGAAAVGVLVAGALVTPQEQMSTITVPTQSVAIVQAEPTTAPAVDPTPAVSAVAQAATNEPVAPNEVAVRVEAPTVVETPAAAGFRPADLATTWADGQIALSWVADMPFVLDENAILIEADATKLSVPIGARLSSVNGLAVDSRDAASAVIRDQLAQSDAMITQLDLGWIDVVGSSELITQVSSEIVYMTSFRNGLLFQTKQIDGEWVTSVVEAPASESSDLQVGDHIVALVPENTRVGGGSSLAQMTSAALLAKGDELQFAVRRGDTLWIADISLAAEAG